MSRGASVVEINGNRYDAATGRLLGAVKTAVASIKPVSGQTMDGFMRRPKPAVRQAPIPQPIAQRPFRSGLVKTAQAVHRRAQHSQTIMRQVVARPKLSSQRSAPERLRTRRQAGIISAKRAFRAKTIMKHPRISRFIAKTTETTTPAATGEVITPTAIAGTATKATATTKALTKPLPSMISSVSHGHLERLLDHALARADAHKQALRGRSHNRVGRLLRRWPRWFSAVIALVVVSLTSIAVAWQKVPQLSLKYAASRANIEASVPSYIPYGYSLAGPVHYKAGSVQIELKSSADKAKKIVITQQASNMDSESLKSATIPASTPVQTTQVNGTPVYIYGKHGDAVFKKGDSKVTIDNQAELPPGELSNIAKGLLTN